jgi:hypothetical protein
MNLYLWPVLYLLLYFLPLSSTPIDIHMYVYGDTLGFLLFYNHLIIYGLGNLKQYLSDIASSPSTLHQPLSQSWCNPVNKRATYANLANDCFACSSVIRARRNQTTPCGVIHPPIPGSEYWILNIEERISAIKAAVDQVPADLATVQKEVRWRAI